MKRSLLFLLCALCAGFVGCSDSGNNAPVPKPAPELTIRPDAPVVFEAEGGSVVIAVETNMPVWHAASDQKWCIVTEEKDRFTVTAVRNRTTSPMPLATVTVVAGAGNRAVSTTLKVSQEAGEDPATDLCERGTSNCYLVTEAGRYSFDATVRGNGAATEGLAVPEPVEGTSAELVWQTAPDMVKKVALVKNKVEFTLSGIRGNALIAVKDDAGAILWSWHIWFPEAEVTSLASAANYQVMNMNLGALENKAGDVKSYGMLYQWGRKDPFPAAATLTGTTSTVGAPLYDADGGKVAVSHSSWSDTKANNLTYATANPTVCISNMAQFAASRDWLQADRSDNALWGNPDGDRKDAENNLPNKGAKSFYDPCPVGWRVPPADVFRSFTASGGYAWVISEFNIADTSGDGALSIDDYDYGWTFNLSPTVSSYFAGAARYDGSYAMLMGSMSGMWGSYWGNSPYPTDMFTGGAYAVLSFQIRDMNGAEMITASPIGGGARADAYSVRCIRE